MKSPRDQKIIDEIRESILDAALEIIVNEGFNSFTMRRLATAIKMTAPNIYNYFANKDEIYINIVIRGFKILHGIMVKASESEENAFSKIKAIAMAYLQFGMEHPQYYDIMFVSSTPKYRDYLGTSFEELSEIEYKISMEIIELVLNAGYAYYNSVDLKEKITREMAERKMVRLWSTLHGMVCLHNSSIIEYVLEDHRNSYLKILDETLDSLAAELSV